MTKHWVFLLQTLAVHDGPRPVSGRPPGSPCVVLRQPLVSFLFLATIAVALLDAGRFHWSHAVP
jgi:hypothetical protein